MGTAEFIFICSNKGCFMNIHIVIASDNQGDHKFCLCGEFAYLINFENSAFRLSKNSAFLQDQESI